jgi:sugar phosphate isomerase/epimerase
MNSTPVSSLPKQSSPTGAPFEARLKVGIDSYCYHRFFGEVYPTQTPPPSLLSFETFLDRIADFGIDGLSIESCFLPRFDSGYLDQLKARLDYAHLDRVYAWGHPDGLEGGSNQEAFAQMLEHIPYAAQIGANVMRIVGSSLRFRFEPHAPQLEKLTTMLREAVRVAADHNVRLAIENHIDYNSQEILELLHRVDSPFLGVNFDTGNFVRVLDDPVEAMERLAPYVLATHIKDLRPVKNVPANAWHFFSCVPTGQGVVQNEELAKILQAHHYRGFLAIEVDHLHPDFDGEEERVVRESIRALRAITLAL